MIYALLDKNRLTPHIVWKKWQNLLSSLQPTHQKELLRHHLQTLPLEPLSSLKKTCRSILFSRVSFSDKALFLSQLFQQFSQEEKYFHILGYHLLRFFQKHDPQKVSRYQAFERCYKKSLIKKKRFVQILIRKLLHSQPHKLKKLRLTSNQG